MASACLTPRAPPTATTVFIFDAYTLRRSVVRALGHTAARKYHGTTESRTSQRAEVPRASRELQREVAPR